MLLWKLDSGPLVTLSHRNSHACSLVLRREGKELSRVQQLPQGCSAVPVAQTASAGAGVSGKSEGRKWHLLEQVSQSGV